VSQPGHTAARGHLRLAGTPSPRRRPNRRFLLVLRATAAALMLAWVTAAASIAAVVALLPLAWRRAPLGRRLRPPRPDARVIPLQPRRREASR